MKITEMLPPPPEGVDVLWRVQARHRDYFVDDSGDIQFVGGSPRLELTWYRVQKWTRCGARLSCGIYVNLDKRISRREWASRTKEEALVSFAEKRKRQIVILNRQLRIAKLELELAQ